MLGKTNYAHQLGNQKRISLYDDDTLSDEDLDNKNAKIAEALFMHTNTPNL